MTNSPALIFPELKKKLIIAIKRIANENDAFNKYFVQGGSRVEPLLHSDIMTDFTVNPQEFRISFAAEGEMNGLKNKELTQSPLVSDMIHALQELLYEYGIDDADIKKLNFEVQSGNIRQNLICKMAGIYGERRTGKTQNIYEAFKTIIDTVHEVRSEYENHPAEALTNELIKQLKTHPDPDAAIKAILKIARSSEAFKGSALMNFERSMKALGDKSKIKL